MNTSFISNKIERLDCILVDQYPQLTRSKWGALVKAGKIKVNDKIITKAGFRVNLGNVVDVDDSTLIQFNPYLNAEDIYLPTLFEDKYLWIIDKPAGIVVHPGPGHSSGTVLNALLWRLGINQINMEIRKNDILHNNNEEISNVWPGLVHRIDRYTTGCLVMAKDIKSQKNLQLQFQNRTVNKYYLAIVRLNNKLLNTNFLEINKPIARHHTNRLRMTISTMGRPSVTKVRVLARSCGLALIECELLTGRTHQIRIHLSHLRMPIIGDTLYGGSPYWKDSNKQLFCIPHVMLHAWKLSINHPNNNNRINIQADIPKAYQEILDRLEMKNP